MTRKFTGKDAHSWKVVSPSGKTLTNDKGERSTFSGYSEARAAESRLPGGVAVRV